MVRAAMAGWWRVLGRVSLVVLALVIVIGLIALFPPRPLLNATGPQVALSDFLTELDAGLVRDVVLQGPVITGILSTGRTFATYTPTDSNFMDIIVQRLMEKGVRIIAKPEDSDVNPLLHYPLAWLPLLLWILAFRFVGVRVTHGADQVAARWFAD
jgi:cell division protease FtsH